MGVQSSSIILVELLWEIRRRRGGRRRIFLNPMVVVCENARKKRGRGAPVCWCVVHVCTLDSRVRPCPPVSLELIRTCLLLLLLLFDCGWIHCRRNNKRRINGDSVIQCCCDKGFFRVVIQTGRNSFSVGLGNSPRFWMAWIIVLCMCYSCGVVLIPPLLLPSSSKIIWTLVNWVN